MSPLCVEEFEAGEAAEAAGDLEEGFVDVGAAFLTDAQAAVLVRPSDRALDLPRLLTEAGSA